MKIIYYSLSLPIANRHMARIAAVFGRQIVKQAGWSLAEAMWYAWDELKKFGDDYRLVKFRKVGGEIAQRIVEVARWSDTHEVKGTGRPLKEGQVLFTDVVRKQAGKYDTISAYLPNIIEIL